MTEEVKRFGFSGPDFQSTSHHNAWKVKIQQTIGNVLDKLSMGSKCPEESQYCLRCCLLSLISRAWGEGATPSSAEKTFFEMASYSFYLSQDCVPSTIAFLSRMYDI